MTEQRYDLLVIGIKDGEDIEIIKTSLAKLYKTDSEKFYFLSDIRLFNKSTILHTKLMHSSAKKKKVVLERIGLLCRIEPSWQLLEKEPEIKRVRLF
jgi:hypothetical protein